MRKRRPFEFGFDDDFFEEFDRIEEMMRQMLDSHLREFEKMDEEELRRQSKQPNFKPRVYGFTLSFGPEGKGELREFGGAGRLQEQRTESKQSEPFVDMINNPDSITLIAELPGVEEKHLQLKAFPKQLSIRVNDPQRFLTKTIALPAEVAWDSLKHSLKNGILEIVLKKKK